MFLCHDFCLGKRPFKCDISEKSFIEYGSLRKHKKINIVIEIYVIFVKRCLLELQIKIILKEPFIKNNSTT